MSVKLILQDRTCPPRALGAGTIQRLEKARKIPQISDYNIRHGPLRLSYPPGMLGGRPPPQPRPLLVAVAIS